MIPQAFKRRGRERIYKMLPIPRKYLYNIRKYKSKMMIEISTCLSKITILSIIFPYQKAVTRAQKTAQLVKCLLYALKDQSWIQTTHVRPQAWWYFLGMLEKQGREISELPVQPASPILADSRLFKDTKEQYLRLSAGIPIHIHSHKCTYPPTHEHMDIHPYIHIHYK